MRLFILLVTLFIINENNYSQAGFLDPDFGNGGWVHSDFGGKDQANAVAIQPDD